MEGSCSPPETALSTAEIAARITELAGHLNAANRRWLALIAEFDRRNGWSDWATHSCAHWLNWQCGIDIGAAREKVRVAHALEKLPLIGAAMGRGELSYSKVRALTRVASAETEAVFLSIALHGTAHHVEAIVRQYRRATEAAELSREARQQSGRFLRYYWDDDGSLAIKARLPAETGTLLLRALETAEADMPMHDNERSRTTDADRCCSAGVSAETFSSATTPHSARRADALGLLAEGFLATGAGALNGGERHQIVIHVSRNALHNHAAGRCELDDGPSIPVETARRLACDSSIVTIHESECGEPLDVGRRTRSIPPALRRAMNARDRGCRFPGCTHTRYVDGHHVRHWADGGETRLSNLVTLCRFHHRQVHEGRIVVQRLDDGAWRFVKPDGASFVSPMHQPAPHDRDQAPCGSPGAPMSMRYDGMQLVADHHARGLAIDERTAATRWRGERMDHGQAITVLMQRAGRCGTLTARVNDVDRCRVTDVSAETSRTSSAVPG
ncbi:MAG TPA: DUF222 domain-containing protein [Burkholderiales bacterium]|nr:DUF222 domain-containing protein [Burkholderiales bacterium]